MSVEFRKLLHVSAEGWVALLRLSLITKRGSVARLASGVLGLANPIGVLELMSNGESIDSLPSGGGRNLILAYCQIQAIAFRLGHHGLARQIGLSILEELNRYGRSSAPVSKSTWNRVADRCCGGVQFLQQRSEINNLRPANANLDLARRAKFVPQHVGRFLGEKSFLDSPSLSGDDAVVLATRFSTKKRRVRDEQDLLTLQKVVNKYDIGSTGVQQVVNRAVQKAFVHRQPNPVLASVAHIVIKNSQDARKELEFLSPSVIHSLSLRESISLLSMLESGGFFVAACPVWRHASALALRHPWEVGRPYPYLTVNNDEAMVGAMSRRDFVSPQHSVFQSIFGQKLSRYRHLEHLSRSITGAGIFRSVVEGRDVAVVGPSVDPKDWNVGEQIDAHEVVLRLGKPVVGNEKELGSRTTVRMYSVGDIYSMRAEEPSNGIILSRSFDSMRKVRPDVVVPTWTGRLWPWGIGNAVQRAAQICNVFQASSVTLYHSNFLTKKLDSYEAYRPNSQQSQNSDAAREYFTREYWIHETFAQIESLKLLSKYNKVYASGATKDALDLDLETYAKLREEYIGAE